jgi:hypothetical protein
MLMSRFTKELRQQIVEDFSRRHNGLYDPALFLKEVREKGKDHPAYDWFEWDQSKAAQEHQLWQARSFAKDLRVSFTVEEVGRSGAVTVKTTEMPAVISPVAGRKDGGGYVLTDPNDPEHIAEHCRQAGTALLSWMNRYKAALLHVEGSTKSIERLASELQSVKAPSKTEAA